MKLDMLVEVIARAIGDEYYYVTQIDRMTFHPPTETSQSLILEDAKTGEKFKLEITKL
jgi:hypothetical protein